MVHRLRCSEARGIFLEQGLNRSLLHWQADSSDRDWRGWDLLLQGGPGRGHSRAKLRALGAKAGLRTGPQEAQRTATGEAIPLRGLEGVPGLPGNSVRPYRWQPTRLPCPWDSPGKNTRVGCHFLLQGIFLTQGLNIPGAGGPRGAGRGGQQGPGRHSRCSPGADLDPSVAGRML